MALLEQIVGSVSAYDGVSVNEYIYLSLVKGTVSIDFTDRRPGIGYTSRKPDVEYTSKKPNITFQ